MPERDWAFHCGSQFQDWREHECHPCKHYKPHAELGERCPIEEAVLLAYLGDEVLVPEELDLVDVLAFHPYRCKRRELRDDQREDD